MTSLAEELASLSPEERKLLELTLKEKGIQLGAVQIPPRSEERDHYPLSFAQQRLWFMHQLEPNNSAYHVYSPMRIRGEIDMPALRRSLDLLVARHETLRTTFSSVAGEPVQRVLPPFRQAVPLIDLSGLSELHREMESTRLASLTVQAGFDLEQGPLLRTPLLRLEQDRLSLLLAMHHIISDGWSLGVLFQELLTVYQAEKSGQRAQLAPMPIQYVDFALWQREQLAGEVGKEQLDYWQEQLAGMAPTLDLPTDRPYPRIQTYRGDHLPVLLDGPLTAQLRQLARSEQRTLFVVLLAAYQTVLGRCASSQDVAVGSPIANRNREEIEGLIGFFVNTLVLRTRLDGDPTFRELLARAAEVNAGANAHQDLPFEHLVDAVGSERSLNRPPLYQVTFAFQREPGGGLGSDELQMSAQAVENPVVQVEMAMPLTETADAVVGTLSFNADLFDRSTAQRLLRRYYRLLHQVVAHPERRISQLSLLEPAERHQMLQEWNDRPSVGGAVLFYRQIESTARRQPGEVALLGEGLSLSYGDLEAAANRLARYLRQLGAGPETVVAVALPRSPQMVIALLAVIKAGAAYLPLDPEAPPERLAFMLEDAQAGQSSRVLITFSDTLSELPDQAQPLFLDQADEALAQLPGEPLREEPRADNPAYVIYTSGSTGVPKGVVISHASIGRRLDWSQQWERWPQPFVGLQRTAVTFDVAVSEIFFPLMLGGRLVLAPPGPLDPSRVLLLVREHGVSQIAFPPSLYQVVVEREDFAQCHSLAKMFVSGEAVPAELPAKVAQRLPGVPLVNRYGPTEATIGMVEWPCDPSGRERTVPIGRPFAGADVYLVDNWQRPVPMGTPGELVIGGTCVARGYHRRPALTAERFVPRGLGGAAGERLYLSGDLARYRADGAIEFLGRRDHQVKVRGFRIELGEIDNALRQHPEVREAVVVDRPESSGVVQLVAYTAGFEGSEGPDAKTLANHLARHLPDYMVPAFFVALPELPKLSSGKIDRHSLPEPVVERSEEQRVAPRSELERQLAEIWQEVLELEDVGVQDNFFDLGGHSLLLVRVQSRLEAELGLKVAVLDLFRHPKIADLAEFLRGGSEDDARLREQGQARAEARKQSGTGSSRAVAVVGMALRFPGARSLEEYWANLRDGVESVSRFTREELLAAGMAAAMVDNPDFVPAQGAIEDFDLFDARLFGFSPREARLTDPQQRLFLECCWQALEHAAVDPETYEGAIGLYAGVGATRYWINMLYDPELLPALFSLPMSLANEKDFLPTKVAYKLNLRGPAVNLQTACSTALVATHLATQALLSGECDVAMAGGVSVSDQQVGGYMYELDGVASPDGHCRTFDAKGLGAVAGHGLGVVVLKRLDDALADGDTIHGVLLGTAINNDGSDKVGFTAPSIEGQAQVIAEAQSIAGVGPESIDYVEAHGTATVLGDPIEVAALTEVFGRGKPGQPPAKHCGLGSVKSNFGHLNAAAGVAGLIKTLLALKHRQLPPSLHFETPNPKIDFEHSPFYVVSELRDWPEEEDRPRRAGVSSFGLGGTNAHVVVEEAPAAQPGDAGRGQELLLLSANSEAALDKVTEQLHEHLESHPEANLADVAHTLRVGRRRLPWRRALVCRDRDDASGLLQSLDPQRILQSQENRSGRGVAFLLPGVGDHYPQMGRELYEREPTFKLWIDRAAELLQPLLDLDLREVLYPGEAPTVGKASGEGKMDLRRLLGRDRESGGLDGPLATTRVAQPAVFAVEYALAQLWAEWGVQPEALIGYSLGEYSAAALAGVFSFEDALRLVAERALLIDSLEGGAMLAVPLSEEETLPHIQAQQEPMLVVAARNGVRVTVVSGPDAAVTQLAEQLASQDLPCQRLTSQHAFHSPMMQPIAERFAAAVEAVTRQAPKVPFLSNVTGTWIREEEAQDPEYWVRHLCGTVRFVDGLGELLQDDSRVLLEVGPGQALATSVRQHPERQSSQTVVACLRDGREALPDLAFLLGAAGRLWLAGVNLDHGGMVAHQQRRKLPLPTYPFERQSYLIEKKSSPLAGAAPANQGKKPDVGDWFYVPAWQPAPPPPAAQPLAEGAVGLVLADGAAGAEQPGLAERLATELRERGVDVVLAHRATGDEAPSCQALGPDRYLLNAKNGNCFQALLQSLEESGRQVAWVGHAWTLDGLPPAADAAGFEQAQERGLYSVFALVQALLQRPGADSTKLTVLTQGVAGVDGQETLRPEHGTLAGALRVIRQEYRDLSCRRVDVELPNEGSRAVRDLLAQLCAELAGEASELAVAYRGNSTGARRYVERFEAVHLPAEQGSLPRLRQGGVYLITGGLGRIGLRLAQDLGQRFQAKLVLTGRSSFPERGQWEQVAEELGEAHPTSRKIRYLLDIEASGAEVLTLRADAANLQAMSQAVARTEQRFGRLDGVIYLAGNVRDGLMVPVEAATPEACQRHFHSKVDGLRVLAEVLAGRELDFCALFSSLSTVLGGLGFGPYAAANAYMDAFAQARSQKGASPWLSLDWDGWPPDPTLPANDGPQTEGAMDPQECVEAFRRSLSLSAQPQVVVATRDLDAQLATWLSTEADTEEEDSSQEEAVAGSRDARPDLSTPYVAPTDSAEQGIAEIWQELLGMETVGIHDHYFELGGDSLLATQMLSRVRRQLETQVSFADFFDAPTVAGLAAKVRGQGEQEEDLSELESMLDALDDFDEDAVDAEIARLAEEGSGT